MNDRKQALTWWRKLDDFTKGCISTSFFPNIPIVAVSKSSSKIESMWKSVKALQQESK